MYLKMENYKMGKITNRPWGSFEILMEAPYYTVKILTVKPGECLSLQLHHRRSEHWFVVSGYGIATVDNKDISLYRGCSIDIHPESKHRVENDASDNDLIIIEVQTGECFEEDIERFEDRYGRV
jgi:mannose-6-phosphate isomerase-like protein (cupin superfamily)